MMPSTMASRKLKSGPANTTAILAHTDLLLNAFGSDSFSSSPNIMQEPPKGKSFNEYLVSPFSKLHTLGPIPMENSITPMPHFFATMK